MYIDLIKQQPINTAIEGLFALTKIELIPFKQKEGNFLSCELSDKTGQIRGVIWEDADKQKAKLFEKIVVRIRGQVARHADKPQVVIESFEKADRYDRSELMKALPKDERIRLRKRLLEIYETIKDPIYRTIWKYVIDLKEFWICPGGKGDTHHEYLCGLLEHVVSMMMTSRPFVRDHNLDRELMLTGILVHDIGKICAYTWDVVIDITSQGRLLGHPMIGARMLVVFFKNEEKFDLENEKIVKLFHMIMSHHGEHSEIKPQFKEAVVLNILDGSSASLQRIEKLENEVTDDSSWTRYDWSTQRHYYLGDKKKTKEEKEKEKAEKSSVDDEDAY